MKKPRTHVWIIATLLMCQPDTNLFAQGGGRGEAPVGRTPAPTSAVTGNAAAGKALYFSYACYACHGYNGETGARAFVGNWGHLSSEDEFVAFLRGRSNVAPIVPSTAMPNFGPTSLPDKKAKDIYAYIRTFKSNAPPLKDIPTLDGILTSSKQSKKQ